MMLIETLLVHTALWLVIKAYSQMIKELISQKIVSFLLTRLKRKKQASSRTILGVVVIGFICSSRTRNVMAHMLPNMASIFGNWDSI